ncbi:MAG TPA: DUF2970 domain-containing protein [Methylophilaceae bacterium]|nr:DUF2970 domain-containing protein [Methylophilaceae bacterium]
MSQSEPLSPQEPSSPKRATIFQIFKAISWSMLGVRQQKAYENDVASITLVQAVIAALVGAAMFIATVLILVTLAIKYLS